MRLPHPLPDVQQELAAPDESSLLFFPLRGLWQKAAPLSNQKLPTHEISADLSENRTSPVQALLKAAIFAHTRVVLKAALSAVRLVALKDANSAAHRASGGMHATTAPAAIAVVDLVLAPTIAAPMTVHAKVAAAPMAKLRVVSQVVAGAAVVIVAVVISAAGVVPKTAGP